MFQIEQELLDKGYENITSLICDILDEQRMEKIFHDQKPDVVFHAVHKHVLSWSLNPWKPSKTIHGDIQSWSQSYPCDIRSSALF